MAELSQHVRESLSKQEQYLNANAEILAKAGVGLASTLLRGNKLIAIGCPAVAQHLTAEITGRFSVDRPALPAISLAENPCSLTAIANDYGRDRVYVRQLNALAKPGDFVLAMLDGSDTATREGIEAAQKLGLETLVLELPEAAESAAAEVVANETFLTAGHLLCHIAEKELARAHPEWFDPQAHTA